VAEAARNVVCVGAEPLAITDCLNFGNPDRPDVYYQLEECIKGMADACRALGTPVVSGNASLYNESAGTAIFPTPMVGMVGLLEDVERHADMAFKAEGDLVVLLGERGTGDKEQGRTGFAGRVATLGASEYLEVIHGLVVGRPSLNLELEAAVQRCCREAIRRGLLRSAHDCSDGGMAVALAESAIKGDLGFQSYRLAISGRADAVLFGEAASRIVVSVAPGRPLFELQALAQEMDVPCLVLGEVGGERLIIQGYIELPLSQLADAWNNGLERALSQ